MLGTLLLHELVEQVLVGRRRINDGFAPKRVLHRGLVLSVPMQTSAGVQTSLDVHPLCKPLWMCIHFST